jgi:DNA-binding YbaB/EbfC family protein
MKGGFDLNKLMQQAAQMLAEMAKMQEELADETVEASAGGGMVSVVATGAGEIREIRIAPEAIDPDDPELLADTIVAAVNEALRSSRSLAESRLQQSQLGGLMGGLGNLGLPGM